MIQAHEGQQIRIARVLCIFFMMSVHIPAAVGELNAFLANGLGPFLNVWVNWLGRASVAALSCLSGYLLVRTAARASTPALVGQRARTLLLPMLTWNAVFLALVLVRDFAVGGTVTGAAVRSVWDFIDLLVGLAGPTANPSLFFLRDLFVSLLLVHLALPWLKRSPLLVLAPALVLAATGLGEPVLFRPSILLFVAVGAYAATRTDSLQALLRPGWLLATVAGLLLAHRGMSWLFPDVDGSAFLVIDLLSRAAMVVLALAATGALAGGAIGARVARLEKHIFLAFLMHLPLFSIMWVAWLGAGGTAVHPAYIAFFFAAPVVALGAGHLLGAVVDRFPHVLQLALRGKSIAAAGEAGRRREPLRAN